MGQNQVFCHFIMFASLVFLDIAQDESLEHFLTTNRGKTHEKKIWGAPNWVRNYSFCHFPKVTSLVFLDIAKDCSLGQFLTERNLWPNSNVVKRPLILACFLLVKPWVTGLIIICDKFGYKVVYTSCYLLIKCFRKLSKE